MGWYDGENKITIDSGWLFDGNKSFTARWIKEESKMYILDASGGTCNIESVLIGFNEQYSLPAPTRDGYFFNGWRLGNEYVPQEGEWIYENEDGSIGGTLIANWVSNSAFTFELRDNDTYAISSVDKTISGTLILPESYNGLPITTINANAARGCQQLTNIVISNNITSIGNGAFSYCSSIVSMTLPFVGGNPHPTQDTNESYFKYIFGTSKYNGSYDAGGMFYLPLSLTDVTITGGDLLKSAFSGCSSLVKIVIPNDIESIGSNTFKGCKSLTSINIPNSVVEIDGGAFQNCTSLTSIVLPESLKTIGSVAFQCCSSLKNISIPDSVVEIGNNVFNGCVSMISMNSPFVGSDLNQETASEQSLFGYLFGTISINGGKEVKQYYNSVYYITYYIPESLIHVSVSKGKLLYGSFYGCYFIQSLDIGNDVTTIEERVFRGCTRLAQLKCPFVPDGGLSYCFNTTIPQNLEIITINSGDIGDKTFTNFGHIKSIVLGNNVASVSTNAFQNFDQNCTIYYQGNAEAWASVGYSALELNVYFYSNNDPSISGNYWHYIDEIPTIWGESD